MPYVLTVMLVVTMYIITVWHQEHEQLKHIQLLNTQNETQNLIQISLHEFSLMLDDITLSSENQRVNLNYETGNVTVTYNLISDQKLRLELRVLLNDQQAPTYTHVTHWNV